MAPKLTPEGKEHPLLCVVTLVAIFACKLLVAGAKALWPFLSSPPSIPEALKLTEEVRYLRKQVMDLNHPDTFILASKVQRKLDQKEIVLRKAVASSGTQPQSHNKKFLLSVLQIICPALLVVLYWDKDIIRLSPSVLWPFASLASFPRSDPGLIAIIPWVFVCQRGSDGLMSAGTAALSLMHKMKTSKSGPTQANKNK